MRAQFARREPLTDRSSLGFDPTMWMSAFGKGHAPDNALTAALAPESLGPAAEYLLDAAERSILFCDVLRRRGNQYKEHLAETAPHVLDYPVELLIDGRTLERPVNYA